MQNINFSLNFTSYQVQFFRPIINSNLQFYSTYVNNIYLSFMLLLMNPLNRVFTLQNLYVLYNIVWKL